MIPLRDSVPGQTKPYVTIGLIVANLIVWFWELSNPGVDVHVFRDGFYPCAVEGRCHLPPGFHALPWYESVFTGMFMHANWGHILGNMLFLWSSATTSRTRSVTSLPLLVPRGRRRRDGSADLRHPRVRRPGSASIPNIGASGAIAGVLGAYFVLFPRARVLSLIFNLSPRIPGLLVPRHLVLVLQAWTGGLSLDHPETGGGVAFFAHIGGFTFGVRHPGSSLQAHPAAHPDIASVNAEDSSM